MTSMVVMELLIKNIMTDSKSMTSMVVMELLIKNIMTDSKVKQDFLNYTFQKISTNFT